MRTALASKRPLLYSAERPSDPPIRMRLPAPQTLTTRDTILRYYRTEACGPPVVLAHGMTDNARCYERVIDHLAPKYEVIAYDARGHGGSGRIGGGVAPDAMVGDLAALIAALRLEQPVLVGHSMGAVTAALTAARNPELARGVVLEDPPLPLGHTLGIDPGEPLLSSPRWRDWHQAVVEQRGWDLDRLLTLGRTQHPHWHPIDVAGWTEAHQQVDPAIFELRHPMHDAWHDELVGSLSCPLLLLLGDPQLGSLVDRTQSERLIELLPQAEIRAIPSAGHCIRRDQFPPFVAELDTFLAGL